MKLTILGTGSAAVTKCYNTCFAFSNNNKHFLIDAGGGNQILKILSDNDIKITDIHDIFITHSHTDHILGVVWVIRMIGQNINAEKYIGDVNIYGHDEAIHSIKTICELTLPKKITKHFGNQIKFITVSDGETVNIMGNDITFFDILSTKTKQYGFIMDYNNKKLVCCGDEPLNEKLFDKVKGCDWIMHEAFCLYGERDIFKPYEKHHSTVKEACETAQILGVPNLILYHTEDKNINKNELYTSEGKEFYNGNIVVPNDNDIIVI